MNQNKKQRNTNVIKKLLFQEGDFFGNTIKFGVYLIVFLAIYVNQNFIFPFVFPRTIAFRVIIDLLLALLISQLIFNKRYRPKMSILLGLLTAFVGVMIVSALQGADFYHSLRGSIERSEGIITWVHLVLFFIILISVFKTKNDWQTLFKVILIAGWIQALHALAQTLQIPFVVASGERLIGTLGNASFFATYTLLIIAIAAYTVVNEKSLWYRLSSVILILLNIFLLWQTQTRGAILSLMAGVLIFLVVKLWANKKWKLLISLALISILLPVLLVMNKDATWLPASTTLQKLINISSTDLTSNNRIIIWGVGLESIAQKPLLGWGWENFNSAFNANFNPVITRDVGSKPWYDRAHNVIIEIGVTTGLVGLAVYIALLGWAFYLIQKIPKGNKDNKKRFNESLILTITLIVYILQNLFVFDTINSYILLMIILAFIHSRCYFSIIDQQVEAEFPRTSQKIFISILILALMAPAVYNFNIKPTLANYYVLKAVIKSKEDVMAMQKNFTKAFTYSPPNDYEFRFILTQHTRDQLALRGFNQKTSDLLQFTILAMEQSVEAAPEAVQNYFLLAELYMISGLENSLDLTEEIILRSLDKSPKRYQAYTMLGRINIARGQFDQSIEYFKQAIALNENFAETHWNLGIAYILTKQPDLAQEALGRSFDLGFDIYSKKNILKLLNAYKDSHDLDATINFLENIIEKFPDDEDYRQALDILNQAK